MADASLDFVFNHFWWLGTVCETSCDNSLIVLFDGGVFCDIFCNWQWDSEVFSKFCRNPPTTSHQMVNFSGYYRPQSETLKTVPHLCCSLLSLANSNPSSVIFIFLVPNSWKQKKINRNCSIKVYFKKCNVLFEFRSATLMRVPKTS